MSGEVLLLRNMIVAAMFAALVAVVGQLQIPLPIPITLQTMVVMMAGSVLGARWGAVSMGVFLLLVAFGAPLLAGGKGGWPFWRVRPVDTFGVGFWPPG